MKVFPLIGMLGWGSLMVSEIGASANWWEGFSHPHWWLAGTFFFVAVDCLKDALSSHKRQGE